jgi:hypothetical protein
MSDEKADRQLDSLVKQLRESTKINKKVDKEAKQVGLTPEDVEEFVVRNSGELINQSLEVMNEVKDYIMASGDPDNISALADLIKASSSAIESLNKIVIQNKRSATSLATKSMDVNARYAIEEKKNENAYIATREDIFKKILDEAKVIEVGEEDLDSSLSARS